jgi:hypothetical protein
MSNTKFQVIEIPGTAVPFRHVEGLSDEVEWPGIILMCLAGDEIYAMAHFSHLPYKVAAFELAADTQKAVLPIHMY